ncbi:MAG: hypothetical protein CFE21_15195 [Bacteroidetes bacterium B1(2017)]|nr:MAG: hypothetical protein CFE21_15195 [Bacteroidetes bacterium B1(2017)]
MRKAFLLIFCSFFVYAGHAQVTNSGMTDNRDSIENEKINISGYVDVYYGFSFNQPKSSDRPYTVSAPRHNEININLAYIDIQYRSDRVRARFVPGVGTYINSNYASESGTLKNIIEANAGVKLSKKKEVWMDVGVIGSPFTNETAISKDHLMYTRSFSAEYAPYYLSGARLTVPLSPKIKAYAYVINGWQQISDVNNPLSVATQIEYKPSDYILFNWNTYVGSEESNQNPTYKNRYFTDLYAIYSKGKFSFTSNVYVGMQGVKDTLLAKTTTRHWWQANFIGKYAFNQQHSVSGRIEYFEDLHEIVAKPITNTHGFSTYSTGLCYNLQIGKHAIFRVEGKHYFSDKSVYISKDNLPIKTDNLLIGNLTVWF